MMSSETTVVHINKDDFDVYIGRGDLGLNHMLNTKVKKEGWLGNPYKVKNYNSRDEVIQKFKKMFYQKLANDEEFKKAVDNLKGKTLGCYCKPKACHGDIIVEYLEDDD